MICSKCNGRGWYDNPRWEGSGHGGVSPSLRCKKCNETGYVLGNVKDVVSTLKRLEMFFKNVYKDDGYLADIQSCIKIIEQK